VLYLEYSFVMVLKLGHFKIPGKFGNVVLEKDGEDELDQSCEK